MSMEISPQHHSIVLGKQNSNLKLIMQRTSTQIMFPDAGDPNIPSLKKSNVIITGSINGVYCARQHLIGSLPLVLMFDLPENSLPAVDTENISQLMQTLDVFVNIRHKPKQNSLSVIIKGVERNATQIYEARRQLLNTNESRIHATIPITYHISNPNNVFSGNQPNNSSGCLIGLPDNLTNMLTINTHNTSSYGLSPMSHSPSPISLSPLWNTPSIPSLFSSTINHNPYLLNHPNAHLLAATRQAMQANSANKSHQQTVTTTTTTHGQNLGHNLLSEYLSLSSASSTLSSPGDSPRNSVSPSGISDATSHLDITGLLSDLSVNNHRTNENKSSKKSQHSFSAFDYEQKKILAAKTMQSKPNSSEYRTPTPTWSGYGLSCTMPPGLSSTESSNSHSSMLTTVEPADLWDDPKTPLAYTPLIDFGIDLNDDHALSMGMTSTYLDSTPKPRLQKIINGPHNDLASTLTSIGLEKYIRLLTSHEVDMTTLRSLTDKDLSEIGITAWGARRKFQLLIAELNKRSKPFCGSAAPGAERKSSLTNSSIIGTCNTTVDGNW